MRDVFKWEGTFPNPDGMRVKRAWITNGPCLSLVITPCMDVRIHIDVWTTDKLKDSLSRFQYSSSTSGSDG